MKASALLELMLKVAEKASLIAKIIRKEKPLVDLLIEEKSGLEKNSRFFQDFKTLADVLIQETVRHYISQQVPEMGSSIYGEESNKFTNVVGDTVVVEICDTCDQTQELLKTVLNGHDEAARLLAEAVHCHLNNICLTTDADLSVDIDTSDCGIWIDPIDSTGQYIKGKKGKLSECGLVEDGLQCVAILIGLFQKSTGKPILGVAVQPFAEFHKETNSWKSITIWGICYNGVKTTSLQAAEPSAQGRGKVLLSSSESEHVKTALATKFDLVFASGAGYKMLATALGLVNAYVLSHRTVYRWDCCAVHAILLALGGGIVSYKHALEALSQSEDPLTEDHLTKLQVQYTRAGGTISNRRASICGGTESLPGIVAYRSIPDVVAVLELLRE
ncbi:unnamed protein product [Candidula unifasciata]|uniref:inositol-1,4-bisphosphate 1-phosphatase n=1 Tax=Candidula unifasciata TaxID=100452 RepID=A0A8S3ZUE0_9EUPU|nr:unnamed protein product [Candidula unifasciata]